MKINDALYFLKKGYVLTSDIESKTHVFFMDKNLIKINSNNFNALINKDDFLNLYKDNEFYPISEPIKESINLNKDIEYYSKIQKKQ